MSRAPLSPVMLVAALSTGCAGWTDVYAGSSYALSGPLSQNGPSVGAESIFAPRPRSVLNPGSKPFPVGLHNALQVLLAPDVKSLSWLTGLSYFLQPEPIGAYAIAGTNLHVDLLEGRFSFGNFQPYGELGLAARLGARGDGPLATLGLQTMFLYNYLATGDAPRSSEYLTIKFGIGWDVH